MGLCAIGNRVNTTDALAAIRHLDALPEPRRRYLTMLAADARTDADRALIVLEARCENRRTRQQAEADLKAEFQARARWAADNPQDLQRHLRGRLGA